MPFCRRSLCVVLLLIAGGSSWSQESRGTVAGRVLDRQQAVVPGATVEITNTDTGVVTRLKSNGTGYFEMNFLTPGMYSISVVAQGFRKTVRSGLELSVAGRVEVDISLQVGPTSESIQVTESAPLLNTTSASGGLVIDKRQVVNLPIPDANPFILSWMAPGIAFTGLLDHVRVVDNGGTSSFSTMGGAGGHEWTIDGAPVTGTSGRVGFTPNTGAISEFKMEVTSFDAASGFTAGATVNVTSRSGTNEYHGDLYELHYQQRWNATPHFARLAFENAVRRGTKKPDDQRQASGRSHNFGVSLGGPIRVPKLYNGKDRLFFFFNFNGIRSSQASTDTTNFNVPKMAWRQGDFSDLQALDAAKYTVYDPRSARQVGNRVVRTPFPGNKGIPLLNPTYKYYTPLFPIPNDVPGLASPEGLVNYYATALPYLTNYNAFLNRYDYNISQNHRLFGKWYWNRSDTDSADWTYETARGLHSGGGIRQGEGTSTNYIWLVSNATVVDLGVDWTLFNEGNDQKIATAIKPSDVGLPAYMDAKVGDLHTLPSLYFTSSCGIGSCSSTQTFGRAYPTVNRGSTYQAKLSGTTVLGVHSLKYGYNERRYHFAQPAGGVPSGAFTFNNAFMKAGDDTTTAGALGLEWAAFMMGLPSGITIDTNDSFYYSNRFRALYFQDDWRITPKLHVNLGLRYERQGGLTERFNRGLAGGFLFDAKLPFSDLAEAAYARNPLAEVPASQFKVRGGVEYLGTTHDTYTDGTHDFLPRAGVAYQFTPKTVLRAGYGWYADVLHGEKSQSSNTFGFSQPTSTTVTSNLGLTFCCGVGPAGNLSAANNPMVDPFPVRADGSRFDAPYRNQLGLAARVGTSYSFLPRDYHPALQQRWRIGVQKEVTRDMVIEVSYSGARAWIPVTQTVRPLPKQYWSTGNVRNSVVDDALNTNVPNPFYIGNLASLQSSDPVLYRFLSTQSFFLSPTARKNQLLRPFPQMSGLSGLGPGVNFQDARGINKYGDLEIQFEKRFSHGFQSLVTYTRAWQDTKDFYYNEFDTELSWRPGAFVPPSRLVWNGIFELPFGSGRRWVSGSPFRHIVGGWQLSLVYQRQSGPLIDNRGSVREWPNVFFYGDLNNIGQLLNHDQVHSKDIHLWFDPNIAYRGSGPIPAGFQGFEGRAAFQPGSFQVRTFPSRITALRMDPGLINWDVKVLRAFKLKERASAKLSVDLLNLINHTNFGGGSLAPTDLNFGRLTTQKGQGRLVQLNLRVDF